MRDGRSRLAAVLLAVIFLGLLALATFTMPQASADSHSSERVPLFGTLIDNPSITIAGATATTGVTPTTGAHRADVEWRFGAVGGSYGTCTVQAKTSLDGTSFENLGTAVSVTATSNAVNEWSIIEQLGTTSVTSSTVSSTAALGFGRLTEYTFACGAGYGTSAPVAIWVIYK